MSQERVVHPLHQPLKPAIALVVVALLALVLQGASALLVRALGGAYGGSLMSGSLDVGVIVVVILSVGLALVDSGLWLAAFVLGILVAVKGSGKLRLGAILALVAASAGLFFSVTVSGDLSQFSDGVWAAATAFAIFTVVREVLRVLLVLAAVVCLMLGIQQVRRERAALPAL